MSCLLVIATVCFSHVQAVEVGLPSALSRTATVQVAGATIQVQLTSDLVDGEIDPRSLPRACAQGACIAYHKWCEHRTDRVTCHYSTAGRPFRGWLRVSAPDRASFELAEQAVGVTVPCGSAVVPLAEFSVVTNDRAAPFVGASFKPLCPASP